MSINLVQLCEHQSDIFAMRQLGRFISLERVSERYTSNYHMHYEDDQRTCYPWTIDRIGAG